MAFDAGRESDYLADRPIFGALLESGGDYLADRPIFGALLESGCSRQSA